MLSLKLYAVKFELCFVSDEMMKAQWSIAYFRQSGN